MSSYPMTFIMVIKVGVSKSLYHRLGLEFSSIDMTKTDLIRAIDQKNTKLIWIETPSNPSLKITDIAAVVIWQKKDILVVLRDNTWLHLIIHYP